MAGMENGGARFRPAASFKQAPMQTQTSRPMGARFGGTMQSGPLTSPQPAAMIGSGPGTGGMVTQPGFPSPPSGGAVIGPGRAGGRMRMS